METLFHYLVVGVEILAVFALFLGAIFTLKYIRARRDDVPEGVVRTALIVFGVIATLLLIIWLWSSLQSLQSPALAKAWETTKNYWLWILIAGVVLFVGLYFVPKEWETKA